jgi:hypothetical protein
MSLINWFQNIKKEINSGNISFCIKIIYIPEPRLFSYSEVALKTKLSGS